MKLLLSLLLFIFSLGGPSEGNHYKQFIADGPSMTPTISTNDKLLVDTEYYVNHTFERGDLIVFTVSNENMYVKRVIGLPGETVKVDNNQLYINDVIQDEPYLEDAVNKALEQGVSYNLDFAAITVPENSIFVLGDNRRNSADSRIMGAIQYDQVIGKVIEVKHSN